jgi:hypothetical protein
MEKMSTQMLALILPLLIRFAVDQAQAGAASESYSLYGGPPAIRDRFQTAYLTSSTRKYLLHYIQPWHLVTSNIARSHSPPPYSISSSALGFDSSVSTPDR